MTDTDSDKPSFLLHIEGDMTIYRAAELKALILGALSEHPSMEADLSAVTDFDSAGLQLIVLAYRETIRLGHPFRISACSQLVSRLIAAYNLPELLGPDLVEDECTEEALHG